MKGKYQTISLDRLLDPEQPLRDDLSQESVKDLTQSIKQIGVINPLVVKKKDDNYELIAGHRRLVAAGIAGLTEVPCIVVKAKGMEGEVIKLQENLVRDNINPIEWAKHLSYIKEQYKLDNAKIGDMLGMSETWVGQHLQIMEYPDLLLEALRTNRLAFSSARELVQIRDPRKRDLYINHAVKGGLTPSLAVRWRKEANREPLTQAQQPADQREPDTSETLDTPLPNCAVCNEPVPLEEELRLTVHNQCAPKSTMN